MSAGCFTLPDRLSRLWSAVVIALDSPGNFEILNIQERKAALSGGSPVVQKTAAEVAYSFHRMGNTPAAL